jgi:RNA polymerase sigma-70 factor (ECF subfamily)
MKLYRRLGATRALAAPEIGSRGAADLLEGLPEDQRRAVSLRLFSDRSYDQIADDEAVSAQTARKRFSRGLAALRAYLSEEKS